MSVMCAVRGDRGGDVAGVALQGGVEPAQVGHQLPAQVLALCVSGSHRADLVQQRRCLAGGEVALGAAGDEIAQSACSRFAVRVRSPARSSRRWESRVRRWRRALGAAGSGLG
jgi:hypothetical protein